MELLIEIIIVFTTLCQEAQIINSKYVEGTLRTRDDWEFLGRFCFRPKNGKLKYSFDFPVELESQSLLFYFDKESEWQSIYKKNLNCEQKMRPTLRPGSSYRIVMSEFNSLCTKQQSGHSIHCEGQQFFTSSRDMWWYMAISRCFNTSNPGIATDYKLHWMNSNKSDFFRYEFSADEFHILETDIAFLLANLIVLILASISANMLRKKLMFHTTFKIFLFSLCCECIFLIIMLVYYGKYGTDGRENYALKTLGGIIQVIGILGFILMLLLMAKGFTITRGRISSCGTMKLSIFMTLYTLTYAILFFYDAAYSDPAKVVYIYESPPGYGIIGLRILAWIYFTFATFTNLKRYKEKSKFYIPFYILFSLWFWAGFITVLVANYALDKWARARVVNGVDRAVAFGGFVFILFLTRPSNTNKNFPYHVRTSQVGMLTDKGVDDLGERAYESKDTGNKGPDLTALFSISNNRYRMTSKNMKNASSVAVPSTEPVKKNENEANSQKTADKY